MHELCAHMLWRILCSCCHTASHVHLPPDTLVHVWPLCVLALFLSDWPQSKSSNINEHASALMGRSDLSGAAMLQVCASCYPHCNHACALQLFSAITVCFKLVHASFISKKQGRLAAGVRTVPGLASPPA